MRIEVARRRAQHAHARRSRERQRRPRPSAPVSADVAPPAPQERPTIFRILALHTQPLCNPRVNLARLLWQKFRVVRHILCLRLNLTALFVFQKAESLFRAPLSTKSGHPQGTECLTTRNYSQKTCPTFSRSPNPWQVPLFPRPQFGGNGKADARGGASAQREGEKSAVSESTGRRRSGPWRSRW